MRPPNIILFLTDQQRWDTLGAHGNPLALTPHLDRLARRGTFFPNAVTPQPVCGPARACLQTGQFATRCGVHKNGLAPSPGSPRLADSFNAAGYHTAYYGKWHLAPSGHGPVSAPDRMGYQSWLAANSLEHVSGPYSCLLYDEHNLPHRLPGYRSDALLDAGIRFLADQPRDRPFFLCLSFIEPHQQNSGDNYPAPRGLENDYRGRWLPPDLQALGGSSARDWAGYCAMVKRLDDGLGRLLDALDSLGLRQNTVLAFTSDHGCHFKTRGSEYKRTPHESSVRIPLVFSGGPWEGGGEHPCAASLLDIAPSLLATAGLPIPTAMDGVSLLPATTGSASSLPRESFIQFGCWGHPPGRALRTPRWKYAVRSDEHLKGSPSADTYHEYCLYDLDYDPYELDNLVASPAHGPVRQDLRDRLLARILHTEGLTPSILPLPPAPAGQRLPDYPSSP